jgi:lipoprotein NlpI
MRALGGPLARRRPALIALLALACSGPSQAQLYEQAVADFAAGRLEAAADRFDRLAAAIPEQAAQLWQRGIALYYVGRYDDCRAQFELHRTVNPNDVENAAWHFLCVARADSPEAARAALLAVGPDPRRPMSEVYAMFRGELAPGEVLAAAGNAAGAQFFAHLYVGLYAEALGDDDAARAGISAAASERYAPVGGYMHMVARVHLDQLDRRSSAASAIVAASSTASLREAGSAGVRPVEESSANLSPTPAVDR